MFFYDRLCGLACVPSCSRAVRQDVTLAITANLDDTISHKDELHIIVTEGENRLIALTARGTGPTVW